jgi:hypothetical protein
MHRDIEIKKSLGILIGASKKSQLRSYVSFSVMDDIAQMWRVTRSFPNRATVIVAVHAPTGAFEIRNTPSALVVASRRMPIQIELNPVGRSSNGESDRQLH